MDLEGARRHRPFMKILPVAPRTQRMAVVQSYGTRVKILFSYYLGGIYRQLNDKEIFLWAQAIAFRVLVTIVPIVILATGILGQIFLGGEDAFDRVAGYIRSFVPYQSDELINMLRQLQGSTTTFLSIGGVGLLYAVMTLFTTLRTVIANIFQEEWHLRRTILGGYLFDLRMAAQVGLLFLLSFGLSFGMNALNSFGADALMRAGLNYAFLTQGWNWIFNTFGLLLPFLLTVGMFFQLFLFVPKPHPPKRSALMGAVVTGLLWEAAKFAFTFYATQAGRFDRYRTVPGDEGISPFVGVFGLLVAFVFWIYYSGVVLCIGAIFGLLHEKRLRSRRRLRAAPSEEEEPETALALPPGDAAGVPHTESAPEEGALREESTEH